MTSEQPSMRAEVERFCAEIGRNSLIVQGAGGNVSWKDGDTLWIKASGTWLADAGTQDIFVPVDLKHLRHELSNENYAATPAVLGQHSLRPSIETLLHGLMPQRVVVHVHAVDVLALLVRSEWRAELERLSDTGTSWTSVDYCKPGAALAQAVGDALAKAPAQTAVLFMANHGIVIGGEDISAINRILTTVLDRFSQPQVARSIVGDADADPSGELSGYTRLNALDMNDLVTNPTYIDRLRHDWALYPDHVVFLGPKAQVFESVYAFKRAATSSDDLSELVFILNDGIYIRDTFNDAKLAQLRCYYDVVARQRPTSRLRSLSAQQIAELLNWDAERYRMSLAK